MAKLKIHEQDCINALGKPYTEVHKWLDAFFCNPNYARQFTKDLPMLYLVDTTRHRCLRHTQEGLKQIRELFGEDAVKAGEIHIRKDLAEGDQYYGDIPKDTEEFIKIGLW